MAADAGRIYSDVRVRLDKLKGDVKQVETQFDKIERSGKSTAQNNKKNFDKSFKGIQLAGVAAFAAISLGIKAALKLSIDFEQSLANVQSVAGATAAGYEQLEQAALNAGETTRFTASQAADAMYNLASAGFDATQTTEALNGVLLLAGATGSDLASTSKLITSSISQYNLAASDAAYVSNVLAAAISSSQANMGKLSIAMRQVGPVASALNKRIEETVAGLQALFDAGFKGEQAGTALRNIFSILASESDAVTQKVIGLGVAFEDVNINTNSLAEVIGALNEAGLSAGEILGAFGKEVGPGIVSLLNVGEQAINDYEEAITGTDKAAELYAIQNDTLAGSLDRLKSATESAGIALADELEPAIRPVVDLLAGMLRLVSALPGPLRNFISVFVTGVPLILGASVAVKALGAGFAALTGPVGIAVIAIGTAIAAISSLSSLVHDLNLKKAEEEFGYLAEEVKLTATEMSSLSDYIDSTMNAGASITQVVNQMARGFNISREKVVEFIEATKTLTESQKQEIQVVKDQIAQQKAISTEREHHAEVIAAAAGQQKKASQAEIDAEAAKTKAREDARAVRDKAYIDYFAQLDSTRKMVEFGAITEEEAIKAKQKSNDQLIESLVAVDGAYIDVNDEIGVAVDRSKEYEQDLKKLTDAEKESLATKNKITQANAEVAASYASYQSQLELVGKKGRELLEVQRDQAIASAEASEADKDKREDLIDAINKYYTDLFAYQDEEKQRATDKIVIESKEEYQRKIEDIGKTEEQLFELRRQRDIADMRASLTKTGASEDQINDQIDLINKYYDELASEDKKKQIQAFIDSAVQQFTGMASAVSGLFSAISEKRIEEIDKELQAELKARGVAADTDMEKLEERLQAAKVAGDQETVLELEDEVEREKIKAVYAKKKAKVAYEAELFEWKASMTTAIVDNAAAILKTMSSVAFPWNIPLAALQAGAGYAQIATINENKPEAPKLFTGGIIKGSAEGTQIVAGDRGSTEALFNPDQMANLLMAIGNGGGGAAGGEFRLIIANGENREQARFTIEQMVNKGQITIDPDRGIRKT